MINGQNSNWQQTFAPLPPHPDPTSWDGPPLQGYPQYIEFASTRLCTWVEGGTVRVKCLALEHNTMSPVRAGARTARSGVERINHEATTQSSCKGHSVLKKLDCNNKLSLTFNSFRQFGKAMHCIFERKIALQSYHVISTLNYVIVDSHRHMLTKYVSHDSRRWCSKSSMSRSRNCYQ